MTYVADFYLLHTVRASHSSSPPLLKLRHDLDDSRLIGIPAQFSSTHLLDQSRPQHIWQACGLVSKNLSIYLFLNEEGVIRSHINLHEFSSVKYRIFTKCIQNDTTSNSQNHIPKQNTFAFHVGYASVR